jgi:predicted YcjX-like family ATPase
MLKRIAPLLLLATLAAPARAQTQAGSPVDDILKRAKNALNDVNYRLADSLARVVLGYGNLLSRDEQMQAMQLRIAASYPEDVADQRLDTAMVLIRQMIAAGTKALPRDITWAGLDTVVARTVRASQPAKLVLGSRTTAAIVYVADDPQGTIQGLRTVLVPPDVPIRVSIRADKCTPWDTTVTVRAADSVRIGYRNPVCPP